MNSNWKEKLTRIATRQHLRVLAFAVFYGCFSFLVLWTLYDSVLTLNGKVLSIPAPTETILPTEQGATSTPEYMLAVSASEPVYLRIPALSVSAPFETPLELSRDGSVGVPRAYDTVGWYRYSPTPGEVGPAIILGHVDSYKGAAVFYHLGQLKLGDSIEVERRDGSVAVFSVTGYERVNQNEFPMERVYGNIPYAGIRLITCSGTYDRSTNRYDRNLIVYGMLKEVQYPENTQ